MCAGALTAVTAAAGEIAMGAADVVLAGGIEHMGHHPMGEDVDFNPRFVAERLIDESAGDDGRDRREPARPLPAAHEGATRTRSRCSRSSARPPRGRTASCARRSCRWPSSPTTAGSVADRDEFLRPDTTLEGLADAEAAVPRRRPRHRRQLGRADRRRDRGAPRRGGRGRASSGWSRSCASSATRTRASSRS